MKNPRTIVLYRALLHISTLAFILFVFFMYMPIVHVFDVSLYSHIGVLAASLSLIAGVVALIKFDTRHKSKYIFVGFSLLGASLFDLLFIVLGIGGQNPSVAYLSIVSFISFFVWMSPRYRNVIGKKQRKPWIVFSASLISAIIFLFFLGFSLSRNTLIFISTVFLLISLLGYLKKGTWKTKYFDQLYISSILSLLLSQILFLNFSVVDHDMMFVLSEVLKITGYTMSLVGLLMSTHNAFQLSEEHGKTIEARLLASVEKLPVGYVFIELNNFITMYNKKLEEILSTSDSKKINQELLNTLKIAQMSKQAHDEKKTILKGDVAYSDRILNLSATPVIIGTDYVGSVILVNDVTAEKLLDKSKDEFIALASHELRTPLVTINGNIDLIEKFHSNVLKDKELAEIVEDMSVSGERLIEIVDEFLDVSSLEQKKIGFKISSFELVPVVKDLVKTFVFDTKKRGIRLRYELPDDKIVVRADPARTKQILFNVLGNALKFTQKGEIVVSVNKKGNKALVRIKDTGRGIEKRDQKLLFHKFQQVGEDFYKHDSTQGVGLGLYISRMLLHGMKGEIYLVESEKNKGSTFEFSLPLES